MPTAIQRRSFLAPRGKSAVLAGGGASGQPNGGQGALGQDTFVRSQADNSPAAKMLPEEAAAYAKLTAAQRASFDAVFNASNRMGQVALSKMLADGRLLNGHDLRGHATTLDHLKRMATEPLASGLIRKSLLSGMITQAQDPGTISQGARGTCTVTTVEYMLAKRSPAEYARVMTDLATGDGRVTLASGAQAQRVADSTGPDDSGRSDVSRLFEAAMMNYGSGPLQYSNKTDKTGLAGHTFLPGGLLNGEVTKVVNAVLNEHDRTDNAVPIVGALPWTSIGSTHLIRDLAAALARGEMVPVGLDWRGDGEWKPAGHEVLGLKIQDGRFFYRNPWGFYDSVGRNEGGKDGPRRRIEDQGGVESMTLDELKRRITGITVK